ADQRAQQAISTDSPADRRNAARVRGQLAYAGLGQQVLDVQHGVEKTLPEVAIVRNLLITIETAPDPAQWTGAAVALGAGLSGHLARLSNQELKPTAAPAVQAESLSRAAIPFQSDAGWEPAASNHRLRWMRLLSDLADRTATDHW